MTEEEARNICKSEGFKVKKLLEQTENDFTFLCNGWQVVAVVDGEVIPAPTKPGRRGANAINAGRLS